MGISWKGHRWRWRPRRPGYLQLGCSINEGPHPGFAAIDAVTGEVTLRGSGYHGFTGEEPLFRNTDQGYFLGQAVEGDFQITVKSLTKPKATDADARAVLMIRESLGSGSRYTSVGLTATHGLFGQHRTTEYGATNWSKGLANASLSLPITLRLTRRGSIITREYSTDDGKTFQLVGNPITFVLPLAQVVQAGLIVSSNVRARVSEARFSFPQIQKL
jgi:regulation of enolase protein 1 (concanavalin A-like superfamily)